MHYSQEGGHVPVCDLERTMRYLAQRWLLDWRAWRRDLDESHGAHGEMVDAAVSGLPARYRAVLVEEYLRSESRRPRQRQRALYLRMTLDEYQKALDTARLLLAERMRWSRHVADQKRNLRHTANEKHNLSRQPGVA